MSLFKHYFFNSEAIFNLHNRTKEYQLERKKNVWKSSGSISESKFLQLFPYGRNSLKVQFKISLDQWKFSIIFSKRKFNSLQKLSFFHIFTISTIVQGVQLSRSSTLLNLLSYQSFQKQTRTHNFFFPSVFFLQFTTQKHSKRLFFLYFHLEIIFESFTFIFQVNSKNHFMVIQSKKASLNNCTNKKIKSIFSPITSAVCLQ